MNLRKYSTDPKVLLEQGKAIMSSSNETKKVIRSHQGRFHLTPVINGSHVKPYPADFRRSCEEAMCRPKAYNDLWSALF